jgi:hypothetical protein
MSGALRVSLVRASQDEIYAYMPLTGFASLQLTTTKKRNNIVNEEV